MTRDNFIDLYCKTVEEMMTINQEAQPKFWNDIHEKYEALRVLGNANGWFNKEK